MDCKDGKIKFDCLCGLKLLAVGHAADMVWIAISIPEWIAQESTTTEICIDCQSETHISINGTFLTGTNDIYVVNEGGCLFDQRISNLFGSDTVYTIESASVDNDMNLLLRFSNGLVIKTVNDDQLEEDDEMWRLFMKGTAFPHFVVTRHTIEL